MPKVRFFGDVLPGVKYVERPGAYAFIIQSSLLAVVQTGFGQFLPGGGLEPGEDVREGLKREVFEEIGFEVVAAQLLLQAGQYHWSEFYQSYFKKIGSFFSVDVRIPENASCADEHRLLWLKPDAAARTLSQEFQRWAVGEFIHRQPRCPS